MVASVVTVPNINLDKSQKKPTREDIKAVSRFYQPKMDYEQKIRFIVLLCSCIAIQARVHNLGIELKRTGLNTFPEGSYNYIEVLDIFNSNLSELQANLFYNREFYNLKKAFLQNDSITIIHPNAFAEMAKIVQLDLYGNKLTSFHKGSFSGLKSLRNLHLGNNRIMDIDETVLEPLQSLDTLDLSDNLITTLKPSFLKRTPVTELYLENNPLVFPEHGPILESTTLTLLNIQSCNLRKLPSDAFSMLPKLEHLDLSQNQIKFLPEGLLKGQVNLQYLDIGFNLITRIEVEVFHTPTNLEELVCDGNTLEDGMDCELLLEKLREELEDKPEHNPSKVVNTKVGEGGHDDRYGNTPLLGLVPEVKERHGPISTKSSVPTRFIYKEMETTKPSRLDSDYSVGVAHGRKSASGEGLHDNDNGSEPSAGLQKPAFRNPLGDDDPQEGVPTSESTYIGKKLSKFYKDSNGSDRGVIAKEENSSHADINEILIYTILVVAIVDMILLFILLGQIYCYMRLYGHGNNSAYSTDRLLQRDFSM